MLMEPVERDTTKRQRDRIIPDTQTKRHRTGHPRVQTCHTRVKSVTQSRQAVFFRALGG
jgi:hypothetical protein